MEETLLDCICNGAVQRLKELFDNQVNPNTLDAYGQPILSTAMGIICKECTLRSDLKRCSECIRIEACIELLLKYQTEGRRTNLNLQCLNGWTPLHHAVCTNQISYVKLLLESGADYSIQNKSGKTAKDFAFQIHNQEIIDLIESYEIPIKEPECD